MTEQLSRYTEPIEVLPCQIEEATHRAKKQELIYGHNTGHFSLSVEKENTVIGVLGEIVVRDHLASAFAKLSTEIDLKLCTLGSEFDLEIISKKQKYFVHVKSGLWKQWPQDGWHFGIHADQGIQNSNAPLVLVSFLKSESNWPSVGRIEGFIRSQQLQKADLIKKGQRFPSTGVVSRTDNILTKFSDYQNISVLEQYLKLKQS